MKKEDEKKLQSQLLALRLGPGTDLWQQPPDLRRPKSRGRTLHPRGSAWLGSSRFYMFVMLNSYLCCQIHPNTIIIFSTQLGGEWTETANGPHGWKHLQISYEEVG